MKGQIPHQAIQRRGKDKGSRRKKENKVEWGGGAARQLIDLALDTRGLTSNAARNPFARFHWPSRMPHFKGKDRNSETSRSLCSRALQPLVPVWTVLQGEEEIKPLSTLLPAPRAGPWHA
jgi:hypothetical protein